MEKKLRKAYISSEMRIKRIESIPIIYGSTTSGAIGRYYTKKDFPTLSELTEGGYAKDIFLKKDKKRKRMIIEDKKEDNSDKREKDYKDGKKDNTQEEETSLGILASGIADGSLKKLKELGKKDKIIFWYNGIWTIIEKYLEQEDPLIPIELARRVIARTKKGINEVMGQLKKKKTGKYESVSSKTLAKILEMEDLFSYWTYEGILYVMMNTDMINGPYKLKRINNQVTIYLDIEFIDNSDKTSNAKIYKISGIDDITQRSTLQKYKEEIKNAFKRWKGTYIEEETAKFGYPNIMVDIELLDKKYSVSTKVNIINTKSASDKTEHISNVEQKGVWKINNIGTVNMYNHYQYEYGILKIDRNEYIREAAHEFGHLIGLGDAYNGAVCTEEVNEKDIMWSGTIISSNDIEMVLLAVLKNEKQYFYSKGNKIISEAINQ